MANGSNRLDLKRDDARTLMLKMDARLAYAGRERNAAYQLEGERELRHIDYARHLINADFNRAKRETQRRLEYFQTLQEQNRERREKRNLAWCEEEEKDWDRQARARAAQRRTLPKIRVHKNHKAEAVGSIRRDQKREFANKMAREMHLNRSLNALSETYSKHKVLSKQNEAMLGQIDYSNVLGVNKSKPVESLPSVKRTESQGEHIMSNTKYGMPTQKMCLPELPVCKMGPQKSSISQAIASGEVCKLRGIVQNEGKQAGTTGPPQKLSLARTFYMNTSTNPQGTSINSQENPVGFNRTRRRVSIVDLSAGAPGATPGARSRRQFSVVDHRATQSKKRWAQNPTLGSQQQVPLRFYKIEENPFLKEGNNSEINRSNDLIRADKSDEMYVWLGFDSEEEYEKLKRGELLLEFNDDDECSDTSSNADQYPTGERLRKQGELADARPGGTLELSRRTESKGSENREYSIASAGGGMHGMKPLEKFASAAKMVMVVRKFQTNAMQ